MEKMIIEYVEKIILVLLIDISNLFLTNNEINDISYTVLEYGLDNIDKNNVITTSKELFLANKKARI